MSCRVSPFNKCSLICGAICAATNFFTITICGSPIDFLHKINRGDIFPPIWLFIALCTLFSFFAGIAAGAVIYATGRRINIGDYERSSYRGGLFFLSSYYIYLSWYPVFFAGGHMFISLIMVILCLVAAVLCIMCWINCHPAFSSIIMLLFSCWVVYIFIANSIVFFKN